MRTDPRVRQTLNQISQNLESANQTAQANLFTFSQSYIGPCLASLAECAESYTAPCFPDRDERLRRNRARTRGRAEFSFDFYDDWEDDDGSRDALLGWDNDELDRLLAGSGGRSAVEGQPGRERAMSYGTRRDRYGATSGRRKTPGPQDDRADPTIIPNSSMFGFLERLPWKIGGKGLKYRPSAADLQDRAGAARTEENPIEDEGEPLIEDEAENTGKTRTKTQHRKRSDTTGSEATTDSLSSRGDLFPSDDEDDAVPLDDEFAMVLERRTTGSTGEDSGGRKTRGKKSIGSRSSTRTDSSRETRTSGPQQQGGLHPATTVPDTMSPGDIDAPSMTDLQKEEERLREEEEREVNRKREAARSLAMERGMSHEGQKTPDTETSKRDQDTRASPHGDEQDPDTLRTPQHPEWANAARSDFVPALLPSFDKSPP